MEVGKIYIGQLDRRVEIVKYTDGQSTTGAPGKNETTVKTLWAKVEYVGGNEEVGGKVISLNIRNYILRYFEEMLTGAETYFIKDLQDGGEYNVHHVELIGRKEYVKCKTSRRE